MLARWFNSRYSWLVLLVLVTQMLCLSSASAQTRTVLELDARAQPIRLNDWGDYLIDANSAMTAEQVATDPFLKWSPTLTRGIYPLKEGQILWIRFTVPPAPDSERWLVEIPYPALDRASLYTEDRAGQWNEQRTGDLTALTSWPTPHRHPLLVVGFNAEDPTRYLLRIENAQGFSAPIRFVNSAFVLRGEQQVSLFLGVYFGLALLGCVVGLAGGFALRDRAYFYFALCSVLVGLTQGASTGTATLHLWNTSPNWADRSLSVMSALALAAFLMLNATLISLRERSRFLNRIVGAIVLAGCVLAVALGFTPSAIRLSMMVPYLIVVPLMILAINYWAWRRGDRFGGWLLLSAAPFVISAGLAIARFLEWIPSSFITEQGILASLALQMLGILFILLLRSQNRRENNRRIQGIDRVDPATGLINSHVFTERLERLMVRSTRLRHQSAVMLVHLINSDQIQRDFGRKAADELPLRVAERLLSTAREIDTAARISERRFGMLAEGPFSPEEAAMLAPRLVARCLMPYPGLHVECVAQIRIAYAMVPREGVSANVLVAQLDAALEAVPDHSKRAVFLLGPAMLPEPWGPSPGPNPAKKSGVGKPALAPKKDLVSEPSKL